MQLPLILVAAVWCVFGLAESASIEGAHPLQDAHLGVLADAQTPQPITGLLLVKQGQGIIRTCHATWFKQSPGGTIYSYFLTAAECFERGLDGVQYSLRMYQENGTSVDMPVLDDFKVHPEYNNSAGSPDPCKNVTKLHNLAVFKTQYGFPQDTLPLELRSDEKTPPQLPIEIFYWKNVTRDGDLRFELTSLVTKTISTFWCKIIIYPQLLVGYQVCAESGWPAKDLIFTQDQIGTSLIQRDPKVYNRFTLFGIMTTVRPWQSTWPYPMEFYTIAPYITWIESVA